MCCKGFLKIMMFVFNGVIFLAGAAILAVGIWVTVDRVSLLGFLDHIDDAPPELAQLANLGYVLIGVGAFLTLMGFLGCCGAVKESKCMLLSFFVIVLIIFLIEVAAAVVLIVFEPLVQKFLDDIGEKVGKSIEKNYGADESFTSVWNTTMKELKCCGYNNYTDFTGSPFVNSTSLYPDTCCTSSSGRCGQVSAQQASITGCFRSLVKLIENNAVLLAGVALGIAALEIAAMVVSMILYKNVGK
ncbi:tetraspanin 34 [Megalobrama amblycephala]|uniref:tetraspanin 34 n=1 Tax=Megalobrama amblycephala TaxID=75352 RepID=UPI002013CDAB|nr:tetraspanin 34 [Megalobrama amblycephala]XP_048051326.1 tetraspanin 34 [Megalobrama amblycephala]